MATYIVFSYPEPHPSLKNRARENRYPYEENKAWDDYRAVPEIYMGGSILRCIAKRTPPYHHQNPYAKNKHMNGHGQKTYEKKKLLNGNGRDPYSAIKSVGWGPREGGSVDTYKKGTPIWEFPSCSLTQNSLHVNFLTYVFYSSLDFPMCSHGFREKCMRKGQQHPPLKGGGPYVFKFSITK